jgi:hypothetical protein
VAERTCFIPDTHELAWAAGFFDGEGNIRAKPNNQHARIYYHPVIFIPQIDPQVLERFRHAVGRGKVSGPYDRTRYAPNRQPQWYYEVYSFDQVQAVMAMLWKWLSPVKREQARVVFMKRKEQPKLNPEPKFCSIEDCGKPHLARGWCRKHYNIWWGKRRRTVADTTNGISTVLPGTF